MPEAMYDGTGRRVPMGTSLTKAEGFTTIDIRDSNDLHCEFEIDDFEGDIVLKFEDRDLARKLIKLVAQDQLIGFTLDYRVRD